ncbi:MAG: glycosyltransferase [Sarcina sp.]
MYKKKLGIIVPSLSDGGAEKVAGNLSIIYDELGYDVYFLLYENRVSFNYKGKIIDLGISKKSGIGKIFRDFEIYSKIKKVKKQYNFDIVISHLPKTDLMNCLTKQNEKVITTIHNNIDIDYPTYMKKMLPYIIRKSDLIASVSRVGEQYLRNGYKAKNVKTIYNPQMLDEIKRKSEEEVTEIPKEILNSEIIISIGRLNVQKGHWHLIRAFKKVLEEKPDVKLIIIGQGELESSLKNLTKKLDVEKSVIFTGFNPNPYKFLKYANLYVGTSLYEGFGMTIVEAMSLGIPAISTDCISGPREIIAPESFAIDIDHSKVQEFGMLCSNFGDFSSLESEIIGIEEEKLAKSICRMLNDSETYNSLTQKSIQRSKDFDYKNIKLIWKEELESLLGENNG